MARATVVAMVPLGANMMIRAQVRIIFAELGKRKFTPPAGPEYIVITHVASGEASSTEV